MDYPGTQDTTIFSGNGDDNNNGASQNLFTGLYNESIGVVRTLIAFDLKSFNDDYPNAGIESARLYLYPYEVTTTTNSYLYAALQPWGDPAGNWEVNEGLGTYDPANNNEPTWNSYKHNTSTWTTAGAGDTTSGVDGDVAGDMEAPRTEAWPP